MIDVTIACNGTRPDGCLLVSVLNQNGVYDGEHYHIESGEIVSICIAEDKHVVISTVVPAFCTY